MDGIGIREVAKQADVSTATVSHVINGTRFVSDETKAKVNNAMQDLNYIPNMAAKTLRSQKTNTIGLVLPDISNHFFTSVVEGIERELHEHDFQLLVGNSGESLNVELQKLKLMHAQQVSGIILASSARDFSEIESYVNGTIPVVLIDRIPKNADIDSFSVNNTEAVRKAIGWLIDQGHEQIGMVAGIEALSTTEDRINGYRQAMLEADKPINDNYIVAGDSKFQGGYEATKEILKNKEITALFVANNLMTIGAMTYLKEKAIKIPEDVAIIGFDDYEWAKITEPTLSVIKQPAVEMGVDAARRLMEIVDNPSQHKVNSKLTTEFIRRESC